MTDDAELLRRYAENQAEAAFSELVERRLNLVYCSALRRTGNPDLAQEAAQYVFIAMARNASALCGHANLTGWLYTATRYAANRALRSERRRRWREQEAYAMQTLHSSHDPNWDGVRPALDSVMDRLSERDRTAVLLRYFEGRSFPEIATILRLSEEASRKRVDRGIERLRRLLARRGITSTSAALVSLLSAQMATAAPAGLATAVSGAALAASGAAISSTVLWSIELMSVTKTTIGTMGVLVLLAAGTAMYESHTASRAEDLLTLENKNAAVRTRNLASLVGQTEAVERKIAEFGILKTPGSAGLPTQNRDARAAGAAFLQAHPEARPLVRQLLRGMASSRYGLFLQSKGLPAVEIDRLEEKLAATMTLVLPMAGGNLYLQTESNSQAEGVEGSSESRIHDALGDPLYAEFQDYNRLTGARTVVEQVVGDTYLTSTPLTSTQAEQLTQLISNNSPTYKNGGGVEVYSVDWESILNQAQSILSPLQMASLEAFRDTQVYTRALQTARRGP